MGSTETQIHSSDFCSCYALWRTQMSKHTLIPELPKLRQKTLGKEAYIFEVVS